MTNRLIHCQSLYLRKHAENPIDWWPWCEEALTTARQQNKPIFLSIGYSSCHWCTVMEGEAFSDAAIASYMNEHFLPIKVDREERPDLDSIYMQTLQMMTGQGGWPLNVFISPDDLVPFYGGTYFPVEPRYGRPGFLQVLQSLRRYYDTQKTDMQGVKRQILGGLQEAVAIANEALSPIGAQTLLEKGLATHLKILQRQDYGPSFPMIPYSDAVLHHQEAARLGTEAFQALEQRGLDLALGGIYDHVAGGFHRYTVDPTWTVPHFEKMLYDNGQIMEYLANLWSMGIEEPAFQRAIVNTSNWLQREMRSPQGYFYAAQDADSFKTATDAEPEEGAFYVWSYRQLQEVLLPAELDELQANFTVSTAGNFEGQNVLQRRQRGVLSEALEHILLKLFHARYGVDPDKLSHFPAACNNHEAKTYSWLGRIPAVTDTKMIVAWNSLMVSGLARGFQVFRLWQLHQLATQAANFILQHQWVGGRLHRLNYDGQPELLAQSEDYALLIKALLDLHQAELCGDRPEKATDWLNWAVQLQMEFDQFFWSDGGGYYNAEAGADLIVRERSYVDNATPAANGVAAANLVRLSLLQGDLNYLERAEGTLNAFHSAMARSPQSCPSLFKALDWYCYPLLVKTTAEHIRHLARQYFPTAVFQLALDLPPGAAGLVCQGLQCLEPAQSEAQMQAQIRASRQSHHPEA